MFVVAGVALWVAFLRARGSGDWLNSYPFISNDGFDWILEGCWLSSWIKGLDAPKLFMLRDPVFVLVTAVDELLSCNGSVVFAVLAIAFFLPLRCIVRYCFIQSIPAPVSVFVATAYCTSSLNIYRMFVLSDSIAMLFMTLSVVQFIDAQESNKNRRRSLMKAAAFATLGGITQTYAALPVLMMASVRRLFRGSGWSMIHATSFIVGIVVTVVLIKIGWRSMIPHEAVPASFGLLEISTGMTSFYARIWIYVGLPILLIMVAMRMRPNADLSNLPVAQLAGAVCGFMLLTYFYQWPETRFTLIYYPVVLLMVVSRAKVARWSDWKEPKRSLDRVCMLVATVIVMAQILFVPLDAWKMKSIRFRPAEFWMVGLLRARPVDRFQIAKSGAEDFAVAQIPKDADAYAARILEAYAAHRKRSVCFSPTE